MPSSLMRTVIISLTSHHRNPPGGGMKHTGLTGLSLVELPTRCGVALILIAKYLALTLTMVACIMVLQ